jgi:thymidylate kinase
VIVELIGCAGAGKTTLRRILCEDGLPGRTVVAMPDLVRDRPLLRRIEHPTAVNVVQEAAGLPYLLRSWPNEREFVALARELLGRPSVSTFDRLNGLRGIARKLGMFELATRRARGMVVLSDEGTVLSAYNLLVTPNVELDRREVDTFLALVPLPERIVYVKAPLATLVQRATARPDPRRQHLGGSRSEIERDIRRTVELFDLIAASPRLENRVLVVENHDAATAERRRVAETIADWLESAAATHRTSDPTTALTALARA